MTKVDRSHIMLSGSVAGIVVALLTHDLHAAVITVLIGISLRTLVLVIFDL
jgi:hypothetical protein